MTIRTLEMNAVGDPLATQALRSWASDLNENIGTRSSRFGVPVAECVRLESDDIREFRGVDTDADGVLAFIRSHAPTTL